MTHAMDKLPEDWLFVTLNRIEDAQTRHAAEFRLGLQEIRTLQAKHELDDKAVEGRVKTLEDKQGERSVFRQHLESTLVATGVIAFYEGAKHLAGWK